MVLFATGSSEVLPGRLTTPSPSFPGLDKGLFLDITRVGTRIVAIGMNGVILYSDDQGKSWTQSSVPVSVLLTAVHFVNERLGWVVGHNGLVLHSADGGTTWQKQLDGWQIDEMVLLSAKTLLKELQAAPVAVEPKILESEVVESGVLGSEMHGVHVPSESEVDPAPEKAVLDVSESIESSSELPVVVAEAVPLDPSESAQDNHSDFLEMDDSSAVDLLYTAESMLLDAQADAAIGAHKPLLDVLFLDERHGFVVGAYGLMLETRDAGKNWSYVGGRIENADRFHLNALARVGEDELWLVGEAGTMFRSDDRGKAWETLIGPYEGSYFGAQAIEGGLLAYGLRGNAFFTTNQGTDWQSISTGVDSTLTASIVMAGNTVFLFGYGGTALKWQSGMDHMQLQKRNGFSTYLGVVGLDSGHMLLIGDRGMSEFVGN